MSDSEIAQALINELFNRVGLTPVEIDTTRHGRLEVPLQGHRSFGAMDYHAVTSKREHIIIEMQVIRHNNFDRRVLFYAALTFANQEFEGGEWAPQIKDVYAIQFVDYSTQGNSAVKYYEMINKLPLISGQGGAIPSLETIKGIHLIQVELKGKDIGDIGFPVQRELSDLEWWWYIIKYSDQFDGGEIARCRELGMPEQMERVLHRLEYDGLDPKKQTEYLKEVENIDSYSNELKRIASEGELRGELKGLFDGFIDSDFQRISLRVVNRIRNAGKSYPRNLVEEVGDSYVTEGQISVEQLRDFIRLLEENEVITG
jgi:hypothetical protein